MGWLFGKTEAIDASANLVEKTGNALDALFTSDDERAAAEVVKQKIAQQPAAWAHQLNMINAQSSSWFNSGWRPALGWVGAIALFVFFVPQFVMASWVWSVAAFSVDWSQPGAVFPAYPVDDAGLWQLIVLLVGGKVIRTVEKGQGIARH